ncbi:hypothetical protein [Chromobacterium violaceum]|uniref:hypothetical protein n=1 Tax=Chromobacterium violaceum TaxID=536 RepID=UPI003CF274F6
MVLTSCNYRKRLLWHSRHVPAWRKTYYADALKPRKIKHSGRQCIKERQKLTFLDIFENAHVDTRYRNPDNPFSLRCSNCFLIVSPLFLLCRLGAGRKAPRIFFILPVPSLCKNIKNHCDTDILSHWRRPSLRLSTARHAAWRSERLVLLSSLSKCQWILCENICMPYAFNRYFTFETKRTLNGKYCSIPHETNRTIWRKGMAGNQGTDPAPLDEFPTV